MGDRNGRAGIKTRSELRMRRDQNDRVLVRHAVAQASVWIKLLCSSSFFGPRTSTVSLLQTVTDDGYFEAHVSEPIGVVQLKLGRLHVQVVVAAGNHRGN
jgi:hypothetical protein